MTTAPFSKTPRSCALLPSWRHDGQDRPDKQTTKFTTPPLFSGENHSCQCPMSSVKEKKREPLEYCCSRERGTSWSRKLSSLRPRITVFFLKGLLSGAINSILGTMISLAFSIFLDMKISGVTLFGGIADWGNDGTEWWNTWNILKHGIYGIL